MLVHEQHCRSRKQTMHLDLHRLDVEPNALFVKNASPAIHDLVRIPYVEDTQFRSSIDLPVDVI